MSEWKSWVSAASLRRQAAALVLSAALGCDRGSDMEEESYTYDEKPLITCQPPTGTFRVKTEPAIVQHLSGSCDLDEAFEQLCIYDGSLESLVDPGCTGTAKRSLAAGCVFEVTETCSDVSTKFALTLYDSGRIDASQQSKNTRCFVGYTLFYDRLVPEKK